MQGYGGKDYWQSTRQHYPALDRLDQLRNGGMARVEAAVRVHDANNRSVQSLAGVAHGFDEGRSEVEGEIGIAVIGKVAFHTLWDGCHDLCSAVEISG